MGSPSDPFDDDGGSAPAANERNIGGFLRDHAAVQRDMAAERRDIAAERRDQAADVRDQAAGQRDQTANERDGAANERDAAANLRDKLADRRDRDPEPAREDASVDRQHAAEDRHAGAAERSQAEFDRDTALADRRAGAAERIQAEHDRETAEADRALAAKDRGTASQDDLTGVYLRGAGFAELKREMARARREDQPLIVAFVDVDHLKAINDVEGHAAGDRVLVEVARALATHLRSYDLIIRYGGDEFVCAMPGLQAANVRERLGRVNASLAQGSGHGSVTCGLAELRSNDAPEDVVARADVDLYEERQRKGHTNLRRPISLVRRNQEGGPDEIDPLVVPADHQ